MISNTQKFALLEKYSRTPQGRSVLAASLQNPLRTQRDYASVARKAYKVDALPPGAMPEYEKDPDARAFVVGEEGDNIITAIKGKRTLVPLFELTAQPEIPITEVTNRRYDVIERTVAKHTSQIGYVEDEKAFGVIDAVCQDPTSPNQDITVAGMLTPSVLVDAMAMIERKDLRVAYMFCNARDFTDIRKWDRDTFDPISQGEILKTGVRASVYGVQIVVTRCVPEGTIYLTAEPEFFGRIPVRYDLTILSADDPKARTIGFSMFECLGIGCFNPWGAQRIIITR